MTRFTVHFTVTERTRREIVVEAASAEEAVALVEEYEFDHYEVNEIDSLEWTLSDVAIAKEDET